MAGAGYKLFNTGDVLTAAQVNTYLQEQTVMVFASSAARTSALSGVLAEGMVSYLQDTNAVEVYNGSAWVGVSGAGDVTEVQAGTGISVASGTGPIPVVTNTMATAIDAAGDLIYGTGADTFARLGIGTAGQVLKVNSGATAPEWGAAGGAAGITLITNTTLSSGTTNINNCFSATYKTYLIVLTITNMGSGANIRFRLRASGTDATTNYKLQAAQFTGSSVSTYLSGSTDFWQFGNADPTKAFFMVDLMNPFATDTTFAFAKSVTGSAGAYTDPLVEYPGAYNTNATSYDGITIYSHNGTTITGNARIYGRADS